MSMPKEYWIVTTENRNKPICFESATEAHAWMRTKAHKCHMRHFVEAKPKLEVQVTEDEARIRRHYTSSSDWEMIEPLLKIIDGLRAQLSTTQPKEAP